MNIIQSKYSQHLYITLIMQNNTVLVDIEYYNKIHYININ
jgi:hypothetical protein